MSHLMRWMLPKQTQVNDTESEQQKNILKSRKAGVRGGQWSGVSLRYLPGVLASHCHKEQGLSCNHFLSF